MCFNFTHRPFWDDWKHRRCSQLDNGYGKGFSLPHKSKYVQRPRPEEIPPPQLSSTLIGEHIPKAGKAKHVPQDNCDKLLWQMQKLNIKNLNLDQRLICHYVQKRSIV
jgi:hypothetical protein